MNTDFTQITIKRSDVPGKIPEIEDLQLGELAINTYDGKLYTKRTREFIGTDILAVSGSGPDIANVYYVTADGSDFNSGKKLGDAKRTIGAAVALAEPGTIIKIGPGNYIENNPITLPDHVSLMGDNLREVTVSLQNQGDLFYVGNGNYIWNLSFTGSSNPGAAIFSFDPNRITYIDQSPYVQNCTNFVPNSIGLKVDGSNAIGPTKSMVLDSYTQYNQGGIGVSITNEGYAQLVSLFTICNDIAVYCGSGGACDLTNSNSSFGTYGLVSDGVSPRKYSGIITAASEANSDTFVVNLSTPTLNIVNAEYDNNSGIVEITTDQPHNFSVGMGITLAGLQFSCDYGDPTIVTYPSGNYGYIFEAKTIGPGAASTTFTVNVGENNRTHIHVPNTGTAKINVNRPYDGQSVYFENLYYSVDKIVVGSGGTGYTSTPTVTISAPSTSWGINATAIAEVKNGSLVAIDIVSSGRGYTSPPTITISSPNIGINTSTATLKVIPNYYTIQSSTPISSGICTIILNENLPYAVGVGTQVPFFKQSRILASGHSFEYIGSGTQISSALPSTGGVPIQENETDQRNGGLVVYTSTDQSGNFRIGDGVAINQNTGTISGKFYSKSLFSTMTPFILALGG
jgi:hypothetical protein